MLRVTGELLRHVDALYWIMPIMVSEMVISARYGNKEYTLVAIEVQIPSIVGKGIFLKFCTRFVRIEFFVFHLLV